MHNLVKVSTKGERIKIPKKLSTSLMDTNSIFVYLLGNYPMMYSNTHPMYPAMYPAQQQVYGHYGQEQRPN